MSEFNPYITADGSLGLYNKEFDDIYHSAGGALSESLEKFAAPVDYDMLLKYDEISVLDICYGLGYNTKSFLSFLYKNQKKFLKKKQKFITKRVVYSDTIHTDNINLQKSLSNNEAIYTDKNLKNKIIKNDNNYSDTRYSDKIFTKIYITAVDNDNLIPFLSPFIKSKIKTSNEKLYTLDSKFNKYFANRSNKNIKIDEIINYSLMTNILRKYPEFYKRDDIANILNKYNCCFSKNLLAIFKEYYNITGTNYHFKRFISNLHNIYYRYISNRYKNKLKSLRLSDITFDLKIDDARRVVKTDDNRYNLIFLDAFSPQKCPCLWSYDFFVELYRLLSEDGMLLTYSVSASVRSAMKEAGFYIGYIYNLKKDKIIGTVAAKKISLIKYPLSEYDLGLLKTKAGIFYRDENLAGQNEAIIAARNLDVQKSERNSTTSYIKQFKKESECTML